MKRTLALMLISFVVGVHLAPATANATAAAHWPRKFAQAANPGDVFVCNNCVAPFNTATAQASMHAGRVPWNNVPNTAVQFDFSALFAQSSSSCPTTVGRINVGATGLSTNLAQTTRCPATGDIERAIILFDTSPSDDIFDWYTGSGTPAADEWDLRSASTHEFGHVTGAADINTNPPPFLCPPQSSDPLTMCGGAFFDPGDTYPRTITSHESSDVQAKYPY
jgi:hypothetical protein